MRPGRTSGNREPPQDSFARCHGCHALCPFFFFSFWLWHGCVIFRLSRGCQEGLRACVCVCGKTTRRESSCSSEPFSIAHPMPFPHCFLFFLFSFFALLAVFLSILLFFFFSGPSVSFCPFFLTLCFFFFFFYHIRRHTTAQPYKPTPTYIHTAFPPGPSIVYVLQYTCLAGIHLSDRGLCISLIAALHCIATALHRAANANECVCAWRGRCSALNYTLGARLGIAWQGSSN